MPSKIPITPDPFDYTIFWQKIELRLLKVDIETAVIYYRKSTRRSWSILQPFYDHGGYAFVRVQHQNQRKAIAVSRLVWMVANEQYSIPEGFDVDHLDTDVTNNHFLNLELKPSSINRRNSTSFGAESF